MNSANQRTRTWVGGLILLAAVVLALAMLLDGRNTRRTAIAELRDECAALRAQLDACNAAISELQAAVQLRAGGSEVPAGGPAVNPFADESGSALARSLAALAQAQSNTAVVLERLLKSTAQIQAPETAEQASRRLQALENSAAEQTQRYVEIKQQATELLLALKIPDEVAILPARQALQMPSLQAYWPYFEVRKELEPVEKVLETLKIRLAQERINAGLQPLAGQGQ